MTVVYIKLDSLCLLARTYPEEAIDSTPSTSGGSITAIDIEDCSSRSFMSMNGSYSSLPTYPNISPLAVPLVKRENFGKPEKFEEYLNSLKSAGTRGKFQIFRSRYFSFRKNFI